MKAFIAMRSNRYLAFTVLYIFPLKDRFQSRSFSTQLMNLSVIPTDRLNWVNSLVESPCLMVMNSSISG